MKVTELLGELTKAAAKVAEIEGEDWRLEHIELMDAIEAAGDYLYGNESYK